MADSSRDIEIYSPHDRLPAERSADPRLPSPTVELPPDFPLTGIFQLLRFRQSTRLASRYTAALDALHGAYTAATRVQDAKIGLQRSTNRLRNIETILDADTKELEEQRFRAIARRARAELESYQALAALNEYKSRGSGGTGTVNAFAEQARQIIQGALGDDGK